MNKRQLQLMIWTVLFACFCSLFSYAQSSLKSSVDRNEILIGEQFKLKVEINFLSGDPHIQWPALDSLQHFELVNTKSDSTYTNRQLSARIQTYTFTSFDSGKWVLPSFMVSIAAGSDYASNNLFTDSVPITVSFSTSDTTNQLRDIKTIREVQTVNTLWYWIAGGILLLAIIACIIWYYLRRKKKPVLPIVAKSNLSAFDEAMLELKNLQQLNYSDAADARIVHTKLADILKRYISRKNHDNYLNTTTGDFLMVLKQEGVFTDLLTAMAAALRTGDAVKFAKYLPPAEETALSIGSIKEVIELLNKNNPPKTV